MLIQQSIEYNNVHTLPNQEFTTNPNNSFMYKTDLLNNDLTIDESRPLSQLLQQEDFATEEAEKPAEKPQLNYLERVSEPKPHQSIADLISSQLAGVDNYLE